MAEQSAHAGRHHSPAGIRPVAGARLPRTEHSLIQDQHTYEEWHAALLPLGASGAMEYEEGLGLYVVLQVNSDGAEEVRLHVPKLGVTSGLGDDYEWQSAQDQRIREVVWKVAVALGLMEPSAAR
jgi:hypothetical protein